MAILSTRGGSQGKAKRSSASWGLAAVAFGYVALDYWRERASWLPESVSSSVQPVLWVFLTCLVLVRAPSYRFWSIEIRAVPKFFACFAFMGLAFAMEIVMVQFATVVLGLDWHRCEYSTVQGASCNLHTALLFTVYCVLCAV